MCNNSAMIKKAITEPLVPQNTNLEPPDSPTFIRLLDDEQSEHYARLCSNGIAIDLPIVFTECLVELFLDTPALQDAFALIYRSKIDAILMQADKAHAENVLLQGRPQTGLWRGRNGG